MEQSVPSSMLPVDLRSLALPLVLLAAYRAGAQSSLATWAAVSHLPAAPQPETPEDAKRLKRKRIRRGVLAVLACVVLYTTELSLIFGTESEKAANVFFNILVGGLMVSSACAPYVVVSLTSCVCDSAAPPHLISTDVDHSLLQHIRLLVWTSTSSLEP